MVILNNIEILKTLGFDWCEIEVESYILDVIVLPIYMLN